MAVLVVTAGACYLIFVLSVDQLQQTQIGSMRMELQSIQEGKLAYEREQAMGLLVTVTGYSSTPDQTWGDPFIMASGKRVYDGALACPRKYEFGTQFMIGDKIYTCEDWLHIRYDDRFDIWFSTRQEALNWGIREVMIFKQ